MLVLPVMASESPKTDSEVSAVTSEESAVPTENPAIPEERQKPLLVDNAGLLTEEESNALLNKLEDISQKYENEVGIVTVNSLEGKTAEAYADDYYDYNGYGYGENDDGLLLLISMGEREWAIGQPITPRFFVFPVNIKPAPQFILMYWPEREYVPAPATGFFYPGRCCSP